jgi:heme exporter protein C
MAPGAKKRSGMAPWKWLLLPWMTAVIVLAYVWAQPLEAFREPESARIIFWHVPMAWLGLLWFAAGAAYGVRFLFGKRQGDLSLDTKVQVANEIGLIGTVLATVTGMVFAARQWGTPWNWDPKQVNITVLILIYLAYFGLRMSVEDPQLRARLSAAYAIFGAVATPFLMFVIPQLEVVKSLHPPGDTITGGLDSKWRTIYTMSALGFLGIMLWIFQLRVQTIELEERVTEFLNRNRGAGQSRARTEAVREPAIRS